MSREGALELARLLGVPALVEDPLPSNGNWEADLRNARPVLAAGREQVAAGAPLLVGASCDVAIATLPAAAAKHPGVRVAWLDAHPDFNTPETSPSGFLGGMPLAAACGVWDAGLLDAPVDPRRVHLIGIRDVDPGERELLAAQGVHDGSPPDGPVFVHLDLDVLRNDLMPAAYPAPGGWDFDQLADALAALPDVVGIEVTGCAPGYAERAASLVAPHLP